MGPAILPKEELEPPCSSTTITSTQPSLRNSFDGPPPSYRGGLSLEAQPGLQESYPVGQFLNLISDLPRHEQERLEVSVTRSVNGVHIAELGLQDQETRERQSLGQRIKGDDAKDSVLLKPPWTTLFESATIVFFSLVFCAFMFTVVLLSVQNRHYHHGSN